MASKKENIKSLFTNTRTRVIIVFTLILLLLAVLIGYFKLRDVGTKTLSNADVSTVPGGIQSIPGSLNQTAEYSEVQEKQNLTQAQEAAKSGDSAIPTIIRTQALGEGVGVIGSQTGQTGVGFSALSRTDQEGPQKSLWIQNLQEGSCSKTVIDKTISEGAQFSDLKAACSCIQLKDVGYSLTDLEPICSCKELKAAGFNARQLKDIGYSSSRLKDCGLDACELRNAGFSAQNMKDGGYSDGELKGAGYSEADIAKASGLPDSITAADIRAAGCNVAALTKLRLAGVTAAAIRRISGCSIEQLKAAGFNAKDLRDAGFTEAELKKAGFSGNDLKLSELDAAKLSNSAKVADCSPASLRKAKLAGVSALTIRQTLGCSAQALKDAGYSAKDLKDAGFTAAELKALGFSAKDLKDAGFSAKELSDAGFSPAELKEAGFAMQDLKDAGMNAADVKKIGASATQLKAAGFTAKDLKSAGYSPNDLKVAGFPPSELKEAGFTAPELLNAGFNAAQLQAAGFTPGETNLAGLPNAGVEQKVSILPGLPNAPKPLTEAQSSAKQLQTIINKQNQQMAEQKYQQKIQQRTSEMSSAANQAISSWKKVSAQSGLVTSTIAEKVEKTQTLIETNQKVAMVDDLAMSSQMRARSTVKTGDILFAVVDTSVNSDEPGPILATIVSGKLKGTKLIGSFNLPTNANKMVITFNTMSIPGAAKTTSISAYAIDANTARTALSSRTDHHYLMRYGSLFASSFIEGFGNAFQSANTTVTIGGTGGGNNISVQNGIGRSSLQNAVIGLATVGKSWGQQAQQLFNTPTTVEVFSGTGIGVLFTQDVVLTI